MNTRQRATDRAGHGTEQIEADLQRRILHGLSCEWDQAVWMLDPAYRRLMTKPLFSLRPFTRRWACWSAERNEISVGLHLVMNHPWAVVRDILHHEMAHQLAHELAGGDTGPPHGPLFREACRLLGADPGGSANYRFLSQSPPETLSAADRMLLRIQKLLKLSESPNPFEAEAALAKAHRLMARYNIDGSAARGALNGYISVVLGSAALRHGKECYMLAGLLQDFYFVSGIWIPSYVVEKGKMGRVLEISGTRRNVRIAAYVHDYVQGCIERLWEAYRREKKPGGRRRSDFAAGIIDGFKKTLTARRYAASGVRDCRPVPASDPVLARYVASRYRRTRRLYRKATRVDETVFNDGVALGKSLRIHEGVEAGVNRRCRRIEHTNGGGLK